MIKTLRLLSGVFVVFGTMTAVWPVSENHAVSRSMSTNTGLSGKNRSAKVNSLG
jgi:hypothetical protein